MKKQTVLVAASAALVLSTCSAMNGMGQMMVDAGEMMMDAGNGNAQTNMPAKVLTAETDLARQEGGVVRLTQLATTEVVTGPAIVTELLANNRGSSSVSSYAWLMPVGSACAATTPNDAFEIDGFHVNRLLVRDGQKLCARADFGTSTLVWAAFRPY